MLKIPQYELRSAIAQITSSVTAAVVPARQNFCTKLEMKTSIYMYLYIYLFIFM